MWHGALVVFRFELRRTMTLNRVAIWLLLVLFPVFIVSVMKYYEPEIEGEIPRDAFNSRQVRVQRGLAWGEEEHDGDGDESGPAPHPRGSAAEAEPNPMDPIWGFVFFGLIPEVITLFGLLLWVPPLVHAELEGRTWIYLAVRPRGRVSVLLGKYLTAITWTALAGWASTTACVLIAQPGCALRLWGTMVALVTLACLAYGAIYSLIGVWLHRRAMAIAVSYTLIFEFLVSFIPAVINKFTVQYRLRNLLFTWMDWWDLVPIEASTLFLGSERAWVHVLILCGIVVAVLGVAAQVIQRREYATIAEA
ncbi:MAG: ABC transporter permease [Planctomycetaceae bacterium]|nr:ABC transporter permease [Planctomycetaceae bacterium]